MLDDTPGLAVLRLIGAGPSRSKNPLHLQLADVPVLIAVMLVNLSLLFLLGLVVAAKSSGAPSTRAFSQT